MNKIALIILLSLPILADFFPKTVRTTVKSVDENKITLNSRLANGMSGIISHKYGRAISAITHTFVSSEGTIELLDSDFLVHDAMPSVNTAVKVGDRVIGGYLYHNVLLLAPNAETYASVVSRYRKNWIHPDLFAMHLLTEGDDKPTLDNLTSFAKQHQVGLIYVVRQGSSILIDPISQKIVSSKNITSPSKNIVSPFYMRLKKLDSGWFGGGSNNDYYETMKSL